MTSIIQDDIAARVQNIATRFLRQARVLDEGSRLTSAQYSALSSLYSHPDITLTELARLENVAHPTMSRTVSGLITQGLVARGTDSGDRRATRLNATPAGRTAYEQVYARRLSLISALMKRLKPETVADLLQAIEGLLPGHQP